MAKRSNPKAMTAFEELLRLCREACVNVQFTPPVDVGGDRTLGEFDGTCRTITIYKNPKDPITSRIIYVFAHEFGHVKQFLEGRYQSVWHRNLGVFTSNVRSETEIASEQDADNYARDFVKQFGLRVSKLHDEKQDA